jgi:beta-lactamase regulating signal transducer with metallopeptidase domain
MSGIVSGAVPELCLRIFCLFMLAAMGAWAIRGGRGPAAMVHVTWLGFLLGTVCLTIAALAAAPIILPLLPSMSLAAAAAPAVPVAQASGIGWQEALLFFYLAGAALLLVRLAYSRPILHRLWSAAAGADSRILTLAAQARADLCVPGDISVRIAPGAVVPMTWGRGRILLPAASLNWSDARLRSILLHECAHIRRGDALAVTIAAAICALFWVHPCVWIAARRMTLAQEEAADDMVLGAGVPGQAYCRDLLEIASGLKGAAPLAAAASHGGNSLEHRFKSVLTARSRAPLSRMARAAALGGALAAAFLTGTLTLGHAQAPEPAIGTAPPQAPLDAGIVPPSRSPDASAVAPELARPPRAAAMRVQPPRPAGSRTMAVTMERQRLPAPARAAMPPVAAPLIPRAATVARDPRRAAPMPPAPDVVPPFGHRGTSSQPLPPRAANANTAGNDRPTDNNRETNTDTVTENNTNTDNNTDTNTDTNRGDDRPGRREKI